MVTVVEKWMVLANKLIEAGVEVIGKGAIPAEEQIYSHPKVIAILLLARTLSHAKGVRMLLNAGRVVEARILTRNCIENGFWIGGLIDEGEGFVGQMIQDEQKRRVSRGQLLFDQRIDLDSDAEKRLREWMKQRKHWHDSKTLNPKGVADGGTFDGAYNFYAELSVDAHPGLESLVRYLARDDGAEIDLEPKINLEEVVDTCHLYAYSVLTVVVGVDQLLGHGAGNLLMKLTDEFQALQRESASVKNTA